MSEFSSPSPEAEAEISVEAEAALSPEAALTAATDQYRAARDELEQRRNEFIALETPEEKAEFDFNPAVERYQQAASNYAHYKAAARREENAPRSE